jgi:hypothetical protein
VKVVSYQEVFDCPDLYSTQEEADILQALHADKRLKELGKQGRIIIKTSDKDEEEKKIVICIYFDMQMTNTSELWVQMGNVSSVKDGRRFLPIHELCSSLSEITCRVLPSAHALSGCNTTSSFFGNGIKLVYKILKDAASDFHDLDNLDNLGDPDKDVAISCSSRFVARLYDQKSFASYINKLRVKLASGRDASLVRLPPSEAALRQHILRASFHTKVWHDSCLAKPPLPSPIEYGWRTVKDSLHPVYFEGNMSAEFHRDLVCSCKWKSQCEKSCVCTEQNLACTDICSCQGSESCKNVHSYTLAKAFNVLTT